MAECTHVVLECLDIIFRKGWKLSFWLTGHYPEKNCCNKQHADCFLYHYNFSCRIKGKKLLCFYPAISEHPAYTSPECPFIHRIIHHFLSVGTEHIIRPKLNHQRIPQSCANRKAESIAWITFRKA